MTFFTHLPAFSRLLLASAGPAGAATFLRRLVNECDAASAIDWDRLLLLAQHERATGVLWRQLREIPEAGLADEYVRRFERLSAIARFHAAYVKSRLGETLAAFAAAGVPVVLLKGAALAGTVYSSFNERPMGDLDLLVDPADLTKARAAARQAGWVEAEDLYPAARYEKHRHIPPMLDSSGGILSLELHTDVFAPGEGFGVTVAELRRDARRRSDHPGDVSVPSPLHSLLSLSVHFAWSHYMRFGVWRTIRDVSALTAQHPELWGQLVDAARARRLGSCVYWTVRLAHTHGGVDVPGSVLAELAPYRSPRVLGPLSRHIELHMLPADTPCPSDWLNGAMWRAAIRPRRSGHGALRPEGVPMAEPATTTAGGVARKVVRQARSLGLWSRYVRRVLFSARAA